MSRPRAAPVDDAERISRIQRSRAESKARVSRALTRLDAITRGGAELAADGALVPAAAAVRRVLACCGYAVPAARLAGAEAGLGGIPDLARRAGGRAREVLLDAGWSDQDIGPLVALRRVVRADSDADAEAATEEHPVSLIRRWRRYHFTDHVTGEQGTLTPAVARTLQPRAYALYPPLPEHADRLTRLMSVLWPGSGRDLLALCAAGALLAVLGALFPLATALIVDVLIPGAESSLLVQLGLALGVGACLTFLVDIMQERAQLRIEGRTAERLQASLWDRVLRLPASFFKGFSSGDLNARITDVERLRELLLELMLSTGITAVFSLFYLVLLWLYLPQLALVAVALVLLLALSSALAGWLKLKHVERLAVADGRLAGLVLQLLQGILKLRVAGAEGRALAQWAERYAEEREATRALRVVSYHYSAFADAFQTLSLGLLFALVLVLAAEQPSAGVFIAFLSAHAAFQSAFVGLSHALLQILTAMPYLERARPILSAPLEQQVGARHPGRLQGEVQVSEVTFAYTPGAEPILSELSLRLEPGEHVALVGPSGSGKSTLLRLLLGFETPQAGAVLFDGQELSSLDLAALRRQIGVVLQTGRVFAGTIYDNIRGASAATLDDCLRAAADAGLERDLEQFPLGLHTPLTEGASTISGGQRQRILIARALVQQPRLLFMDEATSALDNRSQARVTASLERLAVTRLVIAHRLSTIRNADRILVMDAGRVVESGDYDTLIACNGPFARLAQRQIL
ncbi:NHLP bacteriocin export ABC transporter permease/ATPase subunit [Thiorhodococcus mannitoliphagus]|uniref:NHLP bacteriocin export ABC transporter permease/ATPase subunit n=1 Tax=Thiorhodococcus mannitoliphagus TaxID=329406 RepID=A0A6P1DVQ2_9GAMM|nr:NHLP bacteriocin export ABC transporter permease/ATPase subunit [Thiorhodococcus mannitoliphagus]NEX19725.1 NHLP bacteriocin export ABC transporter permease/ATPase subunit [Thiorhodococcus mannitoliphagus]